MLPIVGPSSTRRFPPKVDARRAAPRSRLGGHRVTSTLGPIVIGMLVLATWAPSLAVGQRARGPAIPGETKSEGRNRYRSTQDWTKTIQAFRSTYRDDKRVAWRPVQTPASVRAIFIENLQRGQTWEGINIYEADGKVHIFVVPSDDAPAPSSRGGTRQKRAASP